jgi:hypothetical protein
VDFMTVYCCPSRPLAIFNKVVQGPGLYSVPVLEQFAAILMNNIH